MPDMEKVIKGLEEAETMLTKAIDRDGEMSVIEAFYCYNRVTNALALLKEQDAIEPKTLEHKDGWIEYYCGNCKTYLFQDNAEIRSIIERPKYCSMCGHAVK